MIEADIGIIGAGVMGSAAAYWLSQHPNLRIVLLDQYSVANQYCGSNDANRVFRYAYGHDRLYTQMAVESRHLWVDLERRTGQRLLILTGLLLLDGEDPESNRFNEESYETLRGMNLEAERLEEPELTKRFPQFAVSGAFVDPHGGVLLASKILTTLTSAARTHGVKTLENHQATRLRFHPHPIIETSKGEEIKCRKAIVATGPWSNKLLNDSMVKVTPTRQQIVYLRPKTGLDKYRPGRFPVFFSDHYYGIPAAGIDGVKVSHKGLNDPVDPDTANRSVDPEAVNACKEACRKYIPELSTGEVVETKVCLYDMTENSDFAIGEDPEHSDVIFAYGFSGHGFKFGLLIGKILAELALGQETSADIERFSPLKSRNQATTRPY